MTEFKVGDKVLYKVSDNKLGVGEILGETADLDIEQWIVRWESGEVGAHLTEFLRPISPLPDPNPELDEFKKRVYSEFEHLAKSESPVFDRLRRLGLIPKTKKRRVVLEFEIPTTSTYSLDSEEELKLYIENEIRGHHGINVMSNELVEDE